MSTESPAPTTAPRWLLHWFMRPWVFAVLTRIRDNKMSGSITFYFREGEFLDDEQLHLKSKGPDRPTTR